MTPIEVLVEISNILWQEWEIETNYGGPMDEPEQVLAGIRELIKPYPRRSRQ